MYAAAMSYISRHDIEAVYNATSLVVNAAYTDLSTPAPSTCPCRWSTDCVHCDQIWTFAKKVFF